MKIFTPKALQYIEINFKPILSPIIPKPTDGQYQETIVHSPPVYPFQYEQNLESEPRYTRPFNLKWVDKVPIKTHPLQQLKAKVEELLEVRMWFQTEKMRENLAVIKDVYYVLEQSRKNQSTRFTKPWSYSISKQRQQYTQPKVTFPDESPNKPLSIKNNPSSSIPQITYNKNLQQDSRDKNTFQNRNQNETRKCFFCHQDHIPIKCDKPVKEKRKILNSQKRYSVKEIITHPFVENKEKYPAQIKSYKEK
ncbi:hypothetical protein HUG17_8084 [Dermatophagoides farinae]|uniref:Uncharacterized protein n=1 Tax=Dermatophagoides farinae TaxID=6954 RepID=A0A9D4SGW2_DERFA|nr:hypothetical protein HUG17_8084 [Dermatophagoides farinae]